MSTITPTFKIAGTVIPVVSFDVHGGSVGSAGHMSATTSRKMLQQVGFNLVKESIDASGQLEVDVFVTIDGATTQIFGGEYLAAKFNYKRSSVTIRARDWSGPLIDQKRSLTSLIGGNTGPLTVAESSTSQGVNTQNQKLSQLVTAIANQFSLTPDLRLSSDPGSDPIVGTIFGNTNDTIFTPQPQSLWGILTRLARDTGNIVYTTPQKHLVFGEPGAGLPTLKMFWNTNPVPPGGLPLDELEIDHNPRRNLSFNVVVLSYDPTLGQLTKGKAYVIGSNLSTSQGATVRAGMWGGPQAQSVDSILSTSTSKKNKIPLYTFHVDGLTAAQAQARAMAIAQDISKRELIADVGANFIPLIAPSNPAKLGGDIEDEFSSHDYFVTAYTHSYRVGEKGDGTFGTSAKMLDRQPEGKGSAVSSAEETS